MSDTVPATPEAEALGQGNEVPDVTPEVGQGVVNEPFYTDPHSKTAYGTKEELNQAMKDSFMMRGDYTQKTQALGKDREDLEKKIAENNRFYDETLQHDSELKQFKRLIKERPEVYREMKAKLQQRPSAGTQEEIVKRIVDEQYGPELEEFRGWKKQQEDEQEMNGVYEELTQQYPDLDRASIEEAFGKLDGMKSLVETIYHASKGRDPLAVERAMTEKLAQKQKAGLAPASKTQPSPSVTTGSIDEIGEALRAQLR